MFARGDFEVEAVEGFFGVAGVVEVEVAQVDAAAQRRCRAAVGVVGRMLFLR